MGETADGEHAQPLSSGELAYLAIISAILTLFGGLMSGLNLGMFSLDKRELEVRIIAHQPVIPMQACPGGQRWQSDGSSF